MRESDVEKEVGMLDYWIGDSCKCGTPDQEPACLSCDLKAIRARLLESSLGCYHRKLTYSMFGDKSFISECNHCGKKVKLTREQFDKGVENGK